MKNFTHTPPPPKKKVASPLFFLGFLGTRVTTIGQLHRASRATPHEQTKAGQGRPSGPPQTMDDRSERKVSMGLSLLRVNGSTPTMTTEAT